MGNETAQLNKMYKIYLGIYVFKLSAGEFW